MKKRQQYRFGWSLIALAALAASASGCKSTGFSMPGKSMFSRSRTPDAETLAGNNKVPDLPESPAAKYDPTAMASLGSKPTGKATGSAYGSSPQPGLAAAANGYQTGPYSTTPQTIPPATSVASTATSGALPSPYGGSYQGASASLSTPSTGSPTGDVPLPNSVAAAMSKGAAALGGYTPSAAGGGSLPALPGATATPVDYANKAQTLASTSAYQLPAGPDAARTPAFPASNIYTGTPSNPVGGRSGLPALPNAGPAPAASGGEFTSPTTTASGGNAASSAYQGATTLRPYSPGSTGRSTTYDFSNSNASGATASPPATGAGGSLPLVR